MNSLERPDEQAGGNEESIMAAKAQKLRAKRAARGRPVKQDVARTDSGRISRAANNDEPSAYSVAQETRMRLFNITKDDASQPEAHSVVGRLKLSGEISPDQYEALDRFICSHQSYMKAIQAPDSLKGPGAGSGAADEETDADWRLSVERKFKEARRAIRDAQNYCNGNLYAAIDYLGFRNEFHGHLIGDLRLVGNVLIRHYGLCRAA
jgi:hypothetical protein